MSEYGRPRNRIVIETPGARSRSARPASRGPGPGGREAIVALTVIAAAALATFLALFLTSRPYDPMKSTVEPEQTIPAGSLMMPSPKPAPTNPASPQPNQVAGATPEPTAETAAVPDDAGI